MTRECTKDGWRDADSTYCLPKYHTNENKGYVDWVYRFTNAKYSGFKNDKTNQMMKAIISAYNTLLNDGEVAIYRISQGSIQDSVDVQVRVDCARLAPTLCTRFSARRLLRLTEPRSPFCRS